MNKETTFLHRLQNATMSSGEKARMRSALSAYADTNPYVEVSGAPNLISLFMSSTRFPLYATLTALIIFSGGAGTLAAESSAPGDIFYPIKIHVNEPLMSAFSPSTEGQARVSAELAARRVDEVVTLASSGRLTDENQRYLEEAFNKEVEKTTEHTQELAEKGNSVLADSVHADFTAHLAGGAQALASVPAKPEKAKVFLRRVLSLSSDGEHEQGDETPESVATIVTPEENHLSVSLKNASSSGQTATSSRKAIRPRTMRKEGTKTLFITASTTLNRLFDPSSSRILPKTDRAIQTEDGHKEDSSVEQLLKVEN